MPGSRLAHTLQCPRVRVSVPQPASNHQRHLPCESLKNNQVGQVLSQVLNTGIPVLARSISKIPELGMGLVLPP